MQRTTVKFQLPLYIPSGLYQTLRNIKRSRKPAVAPSIRYPNLLGERFIEEAWFHAHMPAGPGAALDFGTGGSHLALAAAYRGFAVTAIDLQPVNWLYTHPTLQFTQGDLFALNLPKGHFDLILNCSTVEHVGLAGRYGVKTNQLNGDLEAMKRLMSLLKPGGTMLLNVPVGRDAVFPPYARVYGVERLPQLLADFQIEKQAFFVNDQENRWIPCDKETALNEQAFAGSSDPKQCSYALGCWVLRRP